MREIIFRAWYNNKELLEVDTIFFRDGKPFVYLKRGSEVFGQGGCDVVLEQYTGLKDKNGKKIFEGDKVKYDNNVCTVEWSKTQSRFVLWIPKANKFVSLLAGISYEVIGNIHDQEEGV